MKLHFTSNGQARGWGTARSIIDFFFPLNDGQIRSEAATTAATGLGVISRDFYTFRAFFLHYLYELLINPIRHLRVHAGQFASSLEINPQHAMRLGAIALDASTTNQETTASSLSYSHTTSGSNRRLYSGSSGDVTNDKITGITYNSVAESLVGKLLVTGNRYIYLFNQNAPSSGANNVLISASGSILIRSTTVSYSGCNQVTADDASTTNSGSSVTTLTTSVTTVANNCWTVLFGQNAGGSNIAAGTGSTIRGDAAHDYSMFDSNAALTPAGSKSMQFTWSSSQNCGAIMASFAPPPTTFTQSLPVTATAAIALTKVMTALKAFALTATSVTSLSKARIVVKTFTLTATSVISLTKGLVKLSTLAVTATASVVLSKIRIVVKSFALTATSVVSLSKIYTALRALAVSATSALSLSKTYTGLRSFTVTATSVPSLASVTTAIRSLSVTATATISVAKIKTALKSFALTATAVLSLSRIATHFISLSIDGASSSSGPSSPGTTADDATVGSYAWTNPNNAKVSDGVYATAGGGAQSGVGHYLKTTNFGFTLPADATINGILVEAQKASTRNNSNDFIKDSAVWIVKSNGSFGSTNKADTSTKWPTSEGYVSYGGSSDLWGETWASSDINNSNFGVVIAPNETNGVSGSTAQIDHIRITVSYTLHGASAVVSLTKGLVKLSTLAVTATASVVLSKIRTVLQSLSVTGTASVTLSKIKIYVRTLTATAVSQVSILLDQTLRHISLAVTATASVTISKLQSLFKSLSVTATAVTSVGTGRLFIKALAVTASAVATFSRVTTRVVRLSVTATARVKMLVNGLLSIFSSKYPGNSGSYSEKFPSAPGSYSEKYPGRPGTYEDKYPF